MLIRTFKNQRFRGKYRHLLILLGLFVSRIGLSLLFLKSMSVKVIIAHMFLTRHEKLVRKHELARNRSFLTRRRKS